MKQLKFPSCGLLVLSGCLIATVSGCQSQTAPNTSRSVLDPETRTTAKADEAATDKVLGRGKGNSIIINRGSGTKVVSAGNKQVVVANGISYEVRGTETGGTVIIIGDRVEITKGTNKLEFRDGRLIANGRDAGTIKSGDDILLDENGKLFVNKQER